MSKRLTVVLRTFFLGATLISMIILPVPTALAGSVSLTELVNDKGVWDGKEVIVTGEGIGDRMERGEYAWVNILDKGAAIGVWGEKDLMRKISVLGDYSTVGDWVQVKGEFHLSCPEHGGETDIHATEIQVLKPGYKVAHPVQLERAVIAAALLAIATALGIVVFRLKRREHNKHDGRHIL